MNLRNYQLQNMSCRLLKIAWQFAVFLPFVSLQAQIADFPFETNFTDVVNGYTPMTFGTPAIISDDGNQVVQLEGDEYFSLPNELHASIDVDQDVEIQIRFKVTNTYADSPYSASGEFGLGGKRILISNKENDIFRKGFDVYVAQMDEEYRVLMSFGDDTQRGGTFIFNEAIQMNEWVNLKLILRLNQKRPSIVYKLNGYYNHFPLNDLDVVVFKESLYTQQIWIGTDADNAQGAEAYAYAETSLDYVKIFNPSFRGDPNQVSISLEALTNHLNGTTPLTENVQKMHLNVIVTNWDDATYDSITSTILEYISTYESERGTVFEFYAEYVNPKEVDVPRSLQFMLIQYLVDNLYTNSTVASMEGIRFLDHQLIPGAVAPDAPRVSGSLAIDGDYNTDPGYFLNNQEFVIRPTGYYVAPGELAEIRFPASLVNRGVKVQVGAHRYDLREDWIGFQRFPTMATVFEVERRTLSIANPFGGAIYILFSDGSSFGSITVEMDKVVKSPYYSSKTGFSNSFAQYQLDLVNDYVNWVDIESNNFMCTFPKSLADAAPDAASILRPLNTMIGQFNVLAGRPLSRIRSEYIISEPQIYTQGTYPASYPMSIPNGDLDEVDLQALPISALRPQLFMSSYDATTMLHELGHLHNLPTMFEEYETNVNVPAVIAFEAAYGAPLDTGMFYANHSQQLTLDQAALDWMLDPKFRNFEPAGFLEVSYQSRGSGKYVDVAKIFSWDSLGLIHNYWYQEVLNSGERAEGGEAMSPDEYIQVASDRLGLNFAPLWELWGSVPSQNLIDQLAGYPREDRIKERILHYRSIVPSNASEFQRVYNSITPNIEPRHKERYDQMILYYNEQVADSIYSRIDDILCKYFELNCMVTNVGELVGNPVAILPNPTNGIFEITGLNKGYTISIWSANGSLLKKIISRETTELVNISNLPSGQFFVEIKNGQQELLYAKKLIKQ